MKAWVVTEFGGPEKMKWTQWPDPEPGPGQVSIVVKTSGINFAETRMRAGTYSGIGLPQILGLECAGLIEKVGAGVTGFKPGDRVMARVRGSHAEKVAAEARKTMHLPENLSFEEGAAIPVGWHTAWHALVTMANAQPGMTVLIEAVASSVGSAALQIAKHRGCWVGGTASQDAKLKKAKEWGCDGVYNYKTEDIVARIKADTKGRSIDIACATIGGETIQRVLDVMAPHGKVMNYGSTGGRVVSYDLGIGERNVELISMSIDTSRYYPDTIKTFNEQALPLFAAGKFKGIVDTVLPMSELAKAHQMVNDRNHFGKVIMKNG
ncbi:MAG: zinc-binding dehydrogenase [Rhodospirillaceae bacterium]|nr:zinc-binding dehydrogenase [Rhodospirillaceae bacterium]